MWRKKVGEAEFLSFFCEGNLGAIGVNIFLMRRNLILTLYFKMFLFHFEGNSISFFGIMNKNVILKLSKLLFVEAFYRKIFKIQKCEK